MNGADKGECGARGYNGDPRGMRADRRCWGLPEHCTTKTLDIIVFSIN